MKKRVIALLLCAAVAAAMTACNKKEETPPVSNQESEDTKEEETYANGMPKDSDTMNQVMLALALAQEETGKTYAVWDETYFWTACAYLLEENGSLGEGSNEKDGMISLTEDDVREAANALFAAYDGNRKELPAFPENFDRVTFDDASDRYLVKARDMSGEKELMVENCTDQKDGTYTIQASVILSEEEDPVAEYEISMQESSYTASKQPVYAYMITTFDQKASYEPEEEDPQEPSVPETPETEKPNGNIEGNETENTEEPSEKPEKPSQGNKITQQEALALAGKKFGVQGQADPEVGNIYDYKFKEMIKIDGTEYYHFDFGWYVLDDDGNPDHRFRIGHVFVSTDGNTVARGEENGKTWILK